MYWGSRGDFDNSNCSSSQNWKDYVYLNECLPKTYIFKSRSVLNIRSILFLKPKYLAAFRLLTKYRLWNWWTFVYNFWILQCLYWCRIALRSRTDFFLNIQEELSISASLKTPKLWNKLAELSYLWLKGIYPIYLKNSVI